MVGVHLDLHVSTVEMSVEYDLHVCLPYRVSRADDGRSDGRTLRRTDSTKRSAGGQALTGGSTVYTVAGRGAAALPWQEGGFICRTAVMLSSVRSSVPLALRRATAAARPQIHRQAHSVAAELDRRADTAADAPALIVPHQGVHWSYQELRDKAHSLATGLQVTG